MKKAAMKKAAMRSTHCFIRLAALALVLAAALPATLRGQTGDGDGYEAPPITLEGFNTQGSVTFGYRFADIKGYQPMYMELLDLRPGPRLTDFNMFGEAAEKANPFADSYSLSMSGLGGDPFPTAQLTVSKSKLYDFRANWRQSYYNWNQNDNVVLPIAAAAPGLGTGLTDNHNWATVRKFGSADLTLHATNRLRFNFDYYRTTDDGPTFTTRSLDFVGSPGSWGGFARANPYSLYAPLSDDTNRFTGGVDYTYNSWSFHYAIGYQTFTENISLNNITSPELSINPITSSTLEPLGSVSWSQYRKLTTPISEFSFVGKPLAKLQWRGGYMFYRYRGPATFDESASGIAPGSAGPNAPYTFSQSGRATVTEPDNILNLGFTYQIADWWSLNADYRYSRMSSEGIGNFGSLFSQDTLVATPASGLDDIVWRNALSDLDINFDFTPIRTLVIRPGVHFMKADVVSIDNGVTDPALTLETKTAMPEISFGYQPSKKFSIRGDLHSFDSGASYTAITPHTGVGGHLVARVQLTPRVSFEDEMNLTNTKLLDTNFHNNVHSNAATLSYALTDRFSIFGGFSYLSYFAQGDIVYARGTPPLNDFLRDQETNRVWQGGVEAKPTKRLGLRLSGNFDRSTGVGAISGEPPAYGPLTWPLVTGTVYYSFPKAGRLSIDLQRTYYSEQIVTGNNFQANLLTIRWTHDF
ncbi:MAG TPA: hypothetical protein VIH89_19760 [Candidatus Sulfotelmatobacter sp.]